MIRVKPPLIPFSVPVRLNDHPFEFEPVYALGDGFRLLLPRLNGSVGIGLLKCALHLLLHVTIGGPTSLARLVIIFSSAGTAAPVSGPILASAPAAIAHW